MWERGRISLEVAEGVKLWRREVRKREHYIGSSWGYLCTHLCVNDNTLYNESP